MMPYISCLLLPTGGERAKAPGGHRGCTCEFHAAVARRAGGSHCAVEGVAGPAGGGGARGMGQGCEEPPGGAHHRYNLVSQNPLFLVLCPARAESGRVLRMFLAECSERCAKL